MKRIIAVAAFCTFAVGCSSSDGNTNDPGLLAAPPSGEGIQIHVEPFTLQPGEEKTFCLYDELPDDGDIYMNRWESAMAPGSHHMIMYRDVADMIPGGTPPEPGFRLCGMEQARLPMFGSQTEYDDETLPPGVGSKIPSGQKIIVEMHYINYFDHPIDGEVWINLWFTQPEKIEHYAGIFMSYLGGIAIPPGAGVDGAPPTVASHTCPMPAAPPGFDGLQVFTMSGHMHWHGQQLDGWIHDSSTGTDVKQIYTNDDWADPNTVRFPDNEPLELLPNESLRYECSYFNDTGGYVYEGQSADDEMCMLNFGYYPAVEGQFGLDGTILCFDGQLYY